VRDPRELEVAFVTEAHERESQPFLHWNSITAPFRLADLSHNAFGIIAIAGNVTRSMVSHPAARACCCALLSRQ
jgi:hypothetical protein